MISKLIGIPLGYLFLALALTTLYILAVWDRLKTLSRRTPRVKGVDLRTPTIPYNRGGKHG